MSLAVVKVSKAYSEPWLTLDYDEWIAVTKGTVECHYMVGEETNIVSAAAGETIFVEKGQRFKPVFPLADTEYIPVCIPAFKPERCHREDEDRDPNEEKQITDRLAELHKKPEDAGETNDESANDPSDYENCSLFHMCEVSAWKSSLDTGEAYFPPTFAQDGGFTHATSVPEKLIETANHFYTSSKDDWICLKLCSAKTLRNKCGIATIFEEPKPVGTTDVKEEWKKDPETSSEKEDEVAAVFPHIYGGIPVSIEGIVVDVYPMKRDPIDGSFLSITGLTDEQL